jgi:hypothetical protein
VTESLPGRVRGGESLLEEDTMTATRTQPDDLVAVDVELDDEEWRRFSARCAAAGEAPADVARRLLLQEAWRERLRDHQCKLRR